MWIILALSVWLLGSSNGEMTFPLGSASTNTTILTSPFDPDLELRKMSKTCLMPDDFEKLTSGNLRHDSAITMVHLLLRYCAMIIGLSEVRSELGFAPLPPWKAYNSTFPSEDELATAPTIEAYYNLKEPKNKERSLNGTYLFERDTIPAIEFLDEKFPAIREIFRRNLRIIRERNPGVVDRKMVDRFLEKYEESYWKIRETVVKMLSEREKCWYGDLPPTIASPPVYNETEELKKIATFCLTPQDYEDMVGNIMFFEAIDSLFVSILIEESSNIIGLTELRSQLGFSQMHPWKVYNKTKPSENELADAPTPEDYYDLKEPRSKYRSLDANWLLEKNIPPAIAVLDKRLPEIRTVFRRRFETIQTSSREINRQIVDRFLEEYAVVQKLMDEAIRDMNHKNYYHYSNTRNWSFG